GRHDADDRVRPAVLETNRLSDDVGTSAEVTLPERVADDRDIVGPAGRKGAADGRVYAEDVKECGRYASDPRFPALAAVGDEHVALPIQCDLLERSTSYAK